MLEDRDLAETQVCIRLLLLEKLHALFEQFEVARHVEEKHSDGLLLNELNAFNPNLVKLLDLFPCGALLALCFLEFDAENVVSLIWLIELGQDYLVKSHELLS